MAKRHAEEPRTRFLDTKRGYDIGIAAILGFVFIVGGSIVSIVWILVASAADMSLPARAIGFIAIGALYGGIVVYLWHQFQDYWHYH